MRIALLAPPYLPVPPLLYGGTEKIVSLLADGLVDAGHDVTLFASGDSKTKAKLSSIFPEALGNSGLNKHDLTKPLAHYDACYKRAGEFDVVHSHGQYASLAGGSKITTPLVFTWHGSFYPDEAPQEKREQLQKYKHLNYVSISNNQRGGLPDLNFVSTVYNSLLLSEYTYVQKVKNPYLLWVGRMSPKKGALDAIVAAQKFGMRLEIAAAIDPIDKPYFEEVIKPKIDGKTVVYHGEINHDALVELYGGALATLYPITWHEPFGLVMIESMACGTPVVAYDNGSVPEVVEHGLTGYVTDANPEALVAALHTVEKIDRAMCRAMVEKRFSRDRMVQGYVGVYSKLLRT